MGIVCMNEGVKEREECRMITWKERVERVE